MKVRPRVLAVIPARGGSKGLPGKNIKPFMGIPLIAHSIMLAKMCRQINRCIVSTDSNEIADVAIKYLSSPSPVTLYNSSSNCASSAVSAIIS